MKTLIITVLFLGTAAAFAAKGKKAEAADKKNLHAALTALEGFDKNGNKTIDGDEVAAVKKAFADAPTGALAALDKNKDGKLEDDEIKNANPRKAMVAIVREIDADKNRKVEGAEVDALKKKFEANPKGPLATVDHNSNGKLDDDEIAKLNERIAAHAKGGKGSKKKGAAPAASSPTSTNPATESPKPKEGETIKKAEEPAK